MAARIRREKVRMLLPSILLNGFQTPYELLQAGIFGMGPNSSLNQWAGRDDFSLQPLWQLEALGSGTCADQGAARRAVACDHPALQDPGPGGGRRDPGRKPGSNRRRPGSARPIAPCARPSSPSTATSRACSQTIRFGDVLVLVNRPQEVVFALQLMKLAFDEYFITVAEYNRAQFEMFHALGYPARELAYLQPPGDAEPVDTSRPPFLPPVGNGPPPATR